MEGMEGEGKGRSEVGGGEEHPLVFDVKKEDGEIRVKI